MRVRDTRRAAVRNGVAETTEGTDFHCVLEHIRGNRARRAVVVTDDDFDDVGEEHGRRPEPGCGVNSVVAVPADTEVLERLPGHVFVLPEMGEE